MNDLDDHRVMAKIGTDILQAKAYLEKGELVSIPTETVYGLAANAFNQDAVLSIFKAKSRPLFDPLIVHTYSIAKLADLAFEIPIELLELGKRFWPGPLTLLLKKTSLIPDLVTAGTERVGIRIPDHPLTLALLESVEFPLAAPSANPFGYVSPTKPEHVNGLLGDRISYILDGGPCQIGIESTIVGMESNRVVVYRQGGISMERLTQCLNSEIIHHSHKSVQPILPGTLKSHYAPSKKLITGNLNKLLSRYGEDEVGLLSFRSYFPEINKDHQFALSLSGNLDEAAQNLFSALRLLDQQPIKAILAEFVPNRGLGRAINDRLKRASLN